MKCTKCGGTITDKCKLCDLFQAAQNGEHIAALGGHHPKCWPMISTKALNVLPKQVKDANERNRRHGVAVSYNAEGHAIIPDKGAYKAILKLEGMYDKDAYN